MTELAAIARIDTHLLQPIVRRSLGETSAVVTSWPKVRLRGGLTQEVGQSSGLYRIAGEARPR